MTLDVNNSHFTSCTNHLSHQGMFSGIYCTTQELFIMKMLNSSGTTLLQVANK
jgi:hypothetical protein